MLSRTNDVTLRPAHSGYEGNELAVQATSVFLPIPRSVSYAALRTKEKDDRGPDKFLQS